MSSEPHDPERAALWAELDALLPQGPSPRAAMLCQRLRARAEEMEAAGDLEAAELAGNGLIEQFLKNSRDGLAECGSRTPLDSSCFQSATMSWALPGPPALAFGVADAVLAATLRSADALRLAGDETAVQATADLVARSPDCAEAWYLRGLVLGDFRTEQGGGTVRWEDERHQESTRAFYEALVCRPDYYDAKLYKGLALCQAAHAAQAALRAIHGATESLPEAEREGHLAPRRRRFQWDVTRARESLEAAARLRPGDGRAWYELAELYHGLGYTEEARPYLEQLRAVDAAWCERAQVEFSEGQAR